MAEMTEEEFIRQAKLDWDEEEIETIEDALEAVYSNGGFDEVGGDVEAPTGHYYQTERWIVKTDRLGNHTILPFDTSREAEVAFDELEKQYDAWTDEESG